MFTHIRFKVEWKVVLQLDRNDLVKKTFESPNLRRNPFNKFKIFRTVRMERVFKQIFILVLSGDEFRSPCQLYRTDWFNFQTEISRHFVTGDWNGQIIQEKRWTIYTEAFRVAHLTKPFPGPKFPDILVEWRTTLLSLAPSNWLISFLEKTVRYTNFVAGVVNFLLNAKITKLISLMIWNS